MSRIDSLSESRGAAWGASERFTLRSATTPSDGVSSTAGKIRLDPTGSTHAFADVRAHGAGVGERLMSSSESAAVRDTRSTSPISSLVDTSHARLIADHASLGLLLLQKVFEGQQPDVAAARRAEEGYGFPRRTPVSPTFTLRTLE